jgi:hypothetical protein
LPFLIAAFLKIENCEGGIERLFYIRVNLVNWVKEGKFADAEIVDIFLMHFNTFF